MSTVEMSTCDHGIVARIKRVIMERDLVSSYLKPYAPETF